jgi:hypothetical protein
LHYLDSLIGVFREAGFSMQTTLRAIMALDSHAYGFTLQEQAWSFDARDAPAMAARFASRLPQGQYPHLVAMATVVASTPDGVPLDFEFGLDLILDGLDRIRDSA